MTDTTHIRVTESDKARIEELADADLSWPGKVAQVVQMAEGSRLAEQ